MSDLLTMVLVFGIFGVVLGYAIWYFWDGRTITISEDE